MANAKLDKNDNTTEPDRAGEDSSAAKTDKEKDSDSAVDLKPVRPKIGESKDNLRKRAEWFQKRHGGG